MKKSRNSLNYCRTQIVDHEKGGGISLTQPDQSMSLRTLMQRFAQGLPLNVATRMGEYTGDEYVPDIRSLDLAEKQELREQIALRIKEQQEKLSDIQKQKGEDAARKKKEEYDAMVADILQKKESVEQEQK